MRFVVVLFMALSAIGCKSTPLAFNCNSDSQCGGGVCTSGACAFQSPQCPSGYAYDKSAGGLSGQCVPVGDMATAGGDEGDMATAVELVDMSTPPDLVVPIDMTITCGQVGQNCTVGVGACARTGTVMCASPGIPTCTATAGAPDNSGTWHQSPATNGSWDWDCDGYVQYQYPTGDTTPPPRDNDPNAITDCTVIGIQSVCVQSHWYYYLWNHWPDSCGHAVHTPICYWNVNSCAYSGANEVTQGCH